MRELNKTGEPWNAGKRKRGKKREREKGRHGGIWSVRINKRMLIIFGIEYFSFVIITLLANNIEEL